MNAIPGQVGMVVKKTGQDRAAGDNRLLGAAAQFAGRPDRGDLAPRKLDKTILDHLVAIAGNHTALKDLMLSREIEERLN